MAGEIKTRIDLTAVTLYAQIFNKTGQVYRTDTTVFEAYATANIAEYDIAMTEQGTASRFYIGTFPADADVPLGAYDVAILQRIGAAPAETDPLVASGEVWWNGSALYTFPDFADWTAARAAKIDTINSDTDDIQSRLPAALVSGRMDSSVGAVAAGAINAAAIADGAIDAATFAAGAIDAAAIAANAIGASELAADAVTEIQSGLATSASITTAQTDLDDIQTRLPAALVSGRMDSSVGAMAADVITAAAIAADAIGSSELAASAAQEIADALLDRASAVDSYTVREVLKLMAAVLCGKASGGPSNSVFRSVDDAANRVASVSDTSGNRSSMTLTP